MFYKAVFMKSSLTLSLEYQISSVMNKASLMEIETPTYQDDLISTEDGIALQKELYPVPLEKPAFWAMVNL